MSARPQDVPVAADRYEVDFYEWTRTQARLIREGRLDQVDLENVAEEIESMGRSDLRAARSLAVRLIAHSCCLAFSPSQAPRAHWASEVVEFRAQLLGLLEDSPSLRRKVEAEFDRIWATAREAALPKLQADGVDDLPEACPFTLAQLIEPGFVPAAPARRDV